MSPPEQDRSLLPSRNINYRTAIMASSGSRLEVFPTSIVTNTIASINISEPAPIGVTVTNHSSVVAVDTIHDNNHRMISTTSGPEPIIIDALQGAPTSTSATAMTTAISVPFAESDAIAASGSSGFNHDINLQEHGPMISGLGVMEIDGPCLRNVIVDQIMRDREATKYTGSAPAEIVSVLSTSGALATGHESIALVEPVVARAPSSVRQQRSAEEILQDSMNFYCSPDLDRQYRQRHAAGPLYPQISCSLYNDDDGENPSQSLNKHTRKSDPGFSFRGTKKQSPTLSTPEVSIATAGSQNSNAHYSEESKMEISEAYEGTVTGSSGGQFKAVARKPPPLPLPSRTSPNYDAGRDTVNGAFFDDDVQFQMSPYAAAANAEDVDHADDHDENFNDRAASLCQYQLNREEAELLALKRAAYGGAINEIREATSFQRQQRALASVEYSAIYDQDEDYVVSSCIQDQEATVVAISDYEVHPSDPIIANAVRAEWVGADYSHSAASNITTTAAAPVEAFRSMSPPPLSSSETPFADSTAEVYAGNTTNFLFATATEDQSGVMDEQHQLHFEGSVVDPLNENDETTAEATVLDSKPMPQPGDNALVPSWDVNGGEARVLIVDHTISDLPAVGDRKPPPMLSSSHHDASASGNNNMYHHQHHHPSIDSRTDNLDDVGGFAVADQEAEVLYIQEEVHPSEMIANDVEAELVATDYNIKVAVASVEPHHQDLPNQDMNHRHPPEVAAIAEHIGVDEQPFSSVPVVAAAVDVAVSKTGEDIDHLHPAVRATLIQEAHRQEEMIEPAILPTASTLPDHYTAETPLKSDFASMSCLERQPTCGASLSVDGGPSTPTATPIAMGSLATEEMASLETHSVGVVSDILEEDRPDWLRDFPRPHDISSSERNTSWSNSERSSGSSHRNGIEILSTNIARSTTTVMEALFGQSSPPFVTRRQRGNRDEPASCISTRSLLPWSVIYSPPTQMWIATLQTNQKALDKNDVSEASKSLRAFSLPSEKQALCLALAWTPPRMVSFSDHHLCHICHAKFALFRRPHHCRNCGVCTCKDCTVLWPAKMIPETYNIKKENIVHVCKSCDWLSTEFRLSLLRGDRDKAFALHATGNVNLHVPFANVKGELFYPVHCAALGGNLEILKWLVDAYCCPIKSVRVSMSATSNQSKFTPIVTSRGRSLLGIALENANVPMVRYLVVEKGISLAGEKDITPEMLIRNLDFVLRLLSPDIPMTSATFVGDANAPSELDVSDNLPESSPPPPMPDRSFHGAGNERTLSQEARDLGAISYRDAAELDAESGDRKDECIICFDRKIDCVATPCGHQICCLECSTHISRCPVCAANCSFLRVFKP